jgi:hypothetical protein
MTESRFLKLSAGFLNPNAILWAEEHDQGLVVSVTGKESAILLKGNDAKRTRLCLQKRLISLPALDDQE